MSSKDSKCTGTINLVVGGVYYSLLRSDVQAHKDCYFATAIKDEWHKSDQPIAISRDGILFQYIFVYIFNHRNNLPTVVKGPLSLLVSIRREADYYNFPELVSLYDKACQPELQRWCTSQAFAELFEWYTVASQYESPSELVRLVNAELYPSSQFGTLDVTMCNFCLSEPIDLGKVMRLSYPSQIMNDTGEVVDSKHLRSVYYTYEYDRLFDDLRDLLPTFPGVDCLLTDGHVFSLTEGGFLGPSTVGARCTNRVGTAVCVLNSAYTDGVIKITRNGIRESLTKPFEFMIFTSDYACEVGTVTSGTLVFAEFSIVRKDIKSPEYRGVIHMPRFEPFKELSCQGALVQALLNELNDTHTSGGNSADNDNSVVLCLSTLYPIVEFDPSGTYLETDPDKLRGRDVVLYECLKDTFEVSLVTVYVQRYANNSEGCIIGPKPNVTTTSTTPNTTPKITIIAPFHNFRESFAVHSTEKAIIALCYFVHCLVYIRQVSWLSCTCTNCSN